MTKYRLQWAFTLDPDPQYWSAVTRTTSEGTLEEMKRNLQAHVEDGCPTCLRIVDDKGKVIETHESNFAAHHRQHPNEPRWIDDGHGGLTLRPLDEE